MQMQFLDDRSGGGFRQLKEMFGGFSEKEGGPHRLRSPRVQRKEDFSLPAPSKRQPAGDLASGGPPHPSTDLDCPRGEGGGHVGEGRSHWGSEGAGDAPRGREGGGRHLALEAGRGVAGSRRGEGGEG